MSADALASSELLTGAAPDSAATFGAARPGRHARWLAPLTLNVLRRKRAPRMATGLGHGGPGRLSQAGGIVLAPVVILVRLGEFSTGNCGSAGACAAVQAEVGEREDLKLLTDYVARRQLACQ
jgi:hypothetical protein